MKVKYRNKIYDSEEIPLFFYFKEPSRKDDFIDFLANNSLVKEFKKVQSVHVVLAGNTVIKDKRASISISFNELPEKQALQKSIFFNPPDSNAFLCCPGDIEPPDLELWLERYIEHLK